jgi:hypothetical protein
MPSARPAMQSADIGALAAALARAQGEIEGAKKDSANPFFKSKYADLAACWDACREPLSKNELAVWQTPMPSADGAITIATTLAHSSGQWVRSELTMIPDKPGPQALGSCITYARRYALAAMVGLAQVDDDAEGATFRMSPQKQTKIIKAINDAVKAQDGPGLLEVVDELSVEEQLYIWNKLRTDERTPTKKLLHEARAAANPDYLASNDDGLSEKDARRKAVRDANYEGKFEP